MTVIGGQQTNALTMLVTAENWTRFGEVQEAVYGDPEMQALMVESEDRHLGDLHRANARTLIPKPKRPTCCGRRFWLWAG